MKKTIMVMMFVGSLSMLPVQSQAADFELQNTMEDSLYGGMLGALVGGGAMLVSGAPSAHWNYISTGAGIGIIAGAIYGVASATHALAKLDHGKLQVNVPTPELALTASGKLAMNIPVFESQF